MNGSERQKRHREKLILEGKCVVCKQPNFDNAGKNRCGSCTSGKARSDNQSRRHSKTIQNLCNLCGKNPPNPDKLRCEECCVKQREWYKNSDYRERNRVLDKQRRKERRIKVIKHYGNECACCGEKELYFLSIDHVNEDGAKHRAEIMGSAAKGRRIGSTIFYRWLERNNFPDGFQVLCHNCNMGKHMNGGICPHKDGIGQRFVYRVLDPINRVLIGDEYNSQSDIPEQIRGRFDELIDTTECEIVRMSQSCDLSDDQ